MPVGTGAAAVVVVGGADVVVGAVIGAVDVLTSGCCTVEVVPTPLLEVVQAATNSPRMTSKPAERLLDT